MEHDHEMHAEVTLHVPEGRIFFVYVSIYLFSEGRIAMFTPIAVIELPGH